MTKKEVVKWLESLKREIGKAENHTLWHYAESIDMAIEALSSVDLISRQDALNALYGSLNLDTGIAKIESLPSAEPKRKECEEREQGLCPFYAG